MRAEILDRLADLMDVALHLKNFIRDGDLSPSFAVFRMALDEDEAVGKLDRHLEILRNALIEKKPS
jgi:hypothetical protein